MTETEGRVVDSSQLIIPELEPQSGDYSAGELLALIVTYSLVKTFVTFAETAETADDRQRYGDLALSSVASYETAFNRKI
jgi:hypothetical protein